MNRAPPNSIRANVRANAPKTATISGIVKDEYADPLAKAEVVVQPGNYTALVYDSKGRTGVALVEAYNLEPQ